MAHMYMFTNFLQVKLVDVEKVEWLNRRSYSAISLYLGREGRVLLRCDQCLEDWFELLEVYKIYNIYKYARNPIYIYTKPIKNKIFANTFEYTGMYYEQ